CEPLSQARCVLNRFRQICENCAHFAMAFQMAFGISGEQFAGCIKMRVFANTGENIQDFASVRPGVLHTVCSDERQSMRARQIDQFSINAFFTANEMARKLDKNIFAAEDVDQKPSAVCGTVGSARLQRAGFGILPKRTSLE